MGRKTVDFSSLRIKLLRTTVLSFAALWPAQGLAQDGDFKIEWKGVVPEISSADGRFSIKPRGRLLADADWINDNNGTVDASVTEFRAARVGVEGKVFGTAKYKFELDFADHKVTIQDAVITPKVGNVSINLGQFKTANSLEEQTSSRFTTFMERGSFTDAFGFARQLGIGASTGGDNWTFAAGAFRGTANNGDDDKQTALAARATFSPTEGAHLGASFRYRDAGDSLFRYRQRPHNHGSPDRFVETGSVFDADTLIGAEAAYVAGPFAVQGEYAWTFANFERGMEAGFGNPTFSGGYADVSYFITGEKRNYKASKGAFDRVAVKRPVRAGGPGAVQVAARIDYIDLTDNGVFGGEQLSFIAGLNWHPINYIRLMANYSHSVVDKAFDPALGGVNGIAGKNKIDTFGLRFQADW